jgi:hypothetical protein
MQAKKATKNLVLQKRFDPGVWYFSSIGQSLLWTGDIYLVTLTVDIFGFATELET